MNKLMYETIINFKTSRIKHILVFSLNNLKLVKQSSLIYYCTISLANTFEVDYI